MLYLNSMLMWTPSALSQTVWVDKDGDPYVMYAYVSFKSAVFSCAQVMGRWNNLISLVHAAFVLKGHAPPGSLEHVNLSCMLQVSRGEKGESGQLNLSLCHCATGGVTVPLLLSHVFLLCTSQHPHTAWWGRVALSRIWLWIQRSHHAIWYSRHSPPIGR